MTDQKERPNGLVVTDDGGNYYYLRPETLAQAKMPPEDVAKLKAGLQGGKGQDRELSVDDLHAVAGGMNVQAVKLPGITSIGSTASMRMPIGAPGGDRTVQSTIMCPW